MRPSGGLNSTGYGWVTNQRGETTVRWHGGGTGGFRSIIAMNAGTREAAIVLVDSTTPFDDLGVHLVDPDFPLSKKRIGLPTDIDTLKQYAGRYELTPTLAIEIFVEGNKLVAQATAQSAFEVLREGPDAFFYAVVPAKLRFSRAANGEVDSMTLEQEGRELKGKRAPSTR